MPSSWELNERYFEKNLFTPGGLFDSATQYVLNEKTLGGKRSGPSGKRSGSTKKTASTENILSLEESIGHEDYSSYIRNTLSDKVSIEKVLNTNAVEMKKLKYPSMKNRIADFHHYQKKIASKDFKKNQCQLYSDKKADKLYEVLGFGHHGIAYKIRDGTKQYVVKRAFINKLKQYSITQNIDINIPEFNEILHMENINKVIAKKKSQHFPFLYNYTWCPKIDSILLFTEFFDMTLLIFFMRERSVELYYNIMFQLLAASHFMQNTLKIVHNDLTLTNIMMRKVRPGGYWKYKIGQHTYYVPNLGYIAIILDFGMAESKEVLNSTLLMSGYGPGSQSGYGAKDRLERFNKNYDTNYNLKLLFKVLHFDLKIEFLKSRLTAADYKKSGLLSPEVIKIINTVAQNRYKHILYKSMPFIKQRISQRKILEKIYANYIINDNKFDAMMKYIEEHKKLNGGVSIKLPPPEISDIIRHTYTDLTRNKRSALDILGRHFKFMTDKKRVSGTLLEEF